MVPGTDLSRRGVLSAAVLGTAASLVGAGAIGSLAPAAAFGAPAVLPGEPDPNFAEGRVTSIDGSLIRATGSDGTLHRIQTTSATSFWKLTPSTIESVATGDGFYARGLRMPDGSLAADAVWVNIVSLDAHVATLRGPVARANAARANAARANAAGADAAGGVRADGGQVHLDHRGSRIVGHVVPGVSAAVYNGAPAVNDLSLVRVGTHVHVIGAWHPDTNEMDIATLYTAV
ncbi:MAG: cell wall protein [Micromonosporaceae bacterium]|nr:cell wall protein [Micromonosporaceae bacterium]